MDKQAVNSAAAEAPATEISGNGLAQEATPFKDSAMENETISSRVNRRLRLRADAFVLPLITMASVMALLDKVRSSLLELTIHLIADSLVNQNALGFAAIFGLKEDANLQGQQYSWLGSIVYFGYMIAQFPLGWVLVKLPLAKFMAFMVLTWGILVCSIVATDNFAALAAIRFLLGFFEAGIVPVNMILMGIWYRREEQPLRTAVWYNTMAGVLGGIFAFAIARLHSKYPTWKLIFLIYGCVSLALGLAILAILPDHPSRAWFYTEEDKRNKVIRIAVNQTGQNNKSEFRWEQIVESLRDIRFWVLAVYVIAWGIVNAGITNFNPLIISGFGYSKERTALLASPQAAVATFFAITSSAIANVVPNIRCLVWALSTIPGLVGAVLIRTLDPNENRAGALAGVYMMGFYNVSWVMAMSLVSSNNAGATKRSFATTSMSLLYAVGNIIGPQLFLESQAPHYQLGIYAMMVAFATQGVCGALYFLLCLWENKRRDREYGRVEHQAMAGLEAAENDLTDGKNTSFRYCL